MRNDWTKKERQLLKQLYENIVPVPDIVNRFPDKKIWQVVEKIKEMDLKRPYHLVAKPSFPRQPVRRSKGIMGQEGSDLYYSSNCNFAANAARQQLAQNRKQRRQDHGL